MPLEKLKQDIISIPKNITNPDNSNYKTELNKLINTEILNSIHNVKPIITFTGYISGIFNNYKYNNNTNLTSKYGDLYISDLIDYSNILFNTSNDILKDAGWNKEILTQSTKENYIGKFFLNKQFIKNYTTLYKNTNIQKIIDYLHKDVKFKLELSYINKKIQTLNDEYTRLIVIKSKLNEAKSKPQSIQQENIKKYNQVIKDILLKKKPIEKYKESLINDNKNNKKKILEIKQSTITNNIRLLIKYIFKVNSNFFVNKKPYEINKINFISPSKIQHQQKSSNEPIIDFNNIYKISDNNHIINITDVKKNYIKQYISDNIDARRNIEEKLDPNITDDTIEEELTKEAIKKIGDYRFSLLNKLVKAKKEKIIKEIIKSANDKNKETINKLKISLAKASEEDYKSSIENAISELEKKKISEKDISVEEKDNIIYIKLIHQDTNKAILFYLSLYVSHNKSFSDKLNIRQNCNDKKNKLKEIFNKMVDRKVFYPKQIGININSLTKKTDKTDKTNKTVGGKKTRKFNIVIKKYKNTRKKRIVKKTRKKYL